MDTLRIPPIPNLTPAEKRSLHQAYSRALRHQSVLHPKGPVKSAQVFKWAAQQWYPRTPQPFISTSLQRLDEP